MTTTHRIATTSLLILSLAATATSASAMPARAEPASAARTTPAAIYSRPDKSMTATAAPLTAARTAANVTAVQAAVRSETANRGFDWVAAGIGAAAGIALSVLGLGAARGLSQYHTRHTRHTRHTAVLSD